MIDPITSPRELEATSPRSLTLTNSIKDGALKADFTLFLGEIYLQPATRSIIVVLYLLFTVLSLEAAPCVFTFVCGSQSFLLH